MFRPHFYYNLNILFMALIYMYHERNRFPEPNFSRHSNFHPMQRPTIPNLPHYEELRSIYIGNSLIHQKLVKVLVWTKYFKAGALKAVEDWEKKVSESIVQCPVRCQFTANRNFLNQADAVVFYSGNIDKKDMPPLDSLGKQIWVYLDEEPPKRSRWDLQEVPNVFNWTMTYRRDSDIYHPYGQFIPIPKHLASSTEPFLRSKERKSFLTKKPQLVAWTASNCVTSSKREQWVVELRKHIPVQIYGRCGFENHKCINEWPDGCLDEIEAKFKFYLAFENSLCAQYVSEKFFNTLTRNLVPVVYGYENYSRIAPPGSFIDARDFKGPKELAEYLLHLDKTPEEYLKYFEWKDKYRILPKGSGWCRLCQRLSQRKDGERKSYEDIWKWWWFYEDKNEIGDEHLKVNTNNDSKNKNHPACYDADDIL